MKRQAIYQTLLLILCLTTSHLHAEQPPRPNIILCMADDQGWEIPVTMGIRTY